MIKKFSPFINEEVSRNEPIPELRDRKICVILMGAAGVGKSTFIENRIKPKVRNIKSFSSDNLSLLMTKDPNVRHKGAGNLNVSLILNFIESGQSFIFDTTGTYPEAVFKIVDKSRKFGYKTIVIQILSDLETILGQNRVRTRQEPEDFIRKSYTKQFQNMRLYVDELRPDSYYVVIKVNHKYRYYKFIEGHLTRKKSGRNLITKMSEVSESSSDDDLLDSLRQLSDKMKELKSLSKNHIRQSTPLEIYEDYFLEFKEVEKYRVSIRPDSGSQFITSIEMNNLIDKDVVEPEFYRILNKLKSIKKRLEYKFGFDCHFRINLGGKSQAEYDHKTLRWEDYKFLGVGEKRSGYDGTEKYYSDSSSSQPLPENKVPIDITFMIV